MKGMREFVSKHPVDVFVISAVMSPLLLFSGIKAINTIAVSLPSESFAPADLERVVAEEADRQGVTAKIRAEINPEYGRRAYSETENGECMVVFGPDALNYKVVQHEVNHVKHGECGNPPTIGSYLLSELRANAYTIFH